MILPRSRSAGKNTIVFMPALAPCAATEPIRLPVDGHARTSNSNSSAFDVVTVTGRSLNEFVGFIASFLTYSSFRPRRRPRFSALSNGVKPVPMSTAAPGLTGRKSWYRHIVAGPRSIVSRDILLAIES